MASDLFVPRGEPGYRANVFVHADAAIYPAVMAWTKKADKYDWRLDSLGRRGIWISLSELQRISGAGWHQPSNAEMVQQLSGQGTK